MDAMILAAGRGKRLRPLTDSVPKSLATVGDHRLIEHHLLKLSRYGFRNVVINVSYLAEIIKEYLGDGTRYGIHIDYSTEPLQPLGTAGGIVNALEKFHSDSLLVVNGDVYSDIEFSSHDLAGDIDAHLVLVPNPQHHIEGDFCLSGNKVGLPGSSSQTYTFSGIAIYRKSIFQHVAPGYAELGPVLRDLALRNRVTAEVYSGNWIDVGTMDRLELARKWCRQETQSANPDQNVAR